MGSQITTQFMFLIRMLIQLTVKDGNRCPSAGNGLLPNADGRGSSELENNRVKPTSTEAKTLTTSCSSIVDGIGYSACSLPRTHLEAQTHQHVNLSDSIEPVPRSPTTSNSPDIVTNENVGQWRSMELIAEPAHMRMFGIEKLDHLCHLFDYEYWMHVEHFSCHRKLEEGILEELLGILNYGNIDFMTSAMSTSPYNASETSSLVETVKHLQCEYLPPNPLAYVKQMYIDFLSPSIVRNQQIFGIRNRWGGPHHGDIWYVSISLIFSIKDDGCCVANERFYNFHGYHGARLEARQSVRGGATKKRSWLIRLLSPVLFYVPETYLAALNEIYVDDVIKTIRWRPFQGKLRDDWNTYVLISTVLLSASVAFLAVPSVQAAGDNGLWASPAAIPCLVSIIMSPGSITIGLLIVQRVRVSLQEPVRSGSNAVAYLRSLGKRSRIGLEIMAIQYSLPYALLMWSMISFFVSVAIVCFLNVGSNTTTTLTRAIYGSVWLFVAALLVWTIHVGFYFEHTNNLFLWGEVDLGGMGQILTRIMSLIMRIITNRRYDRGYRTSV
ncbi:hypothetical protein M0805_007936 [Coniferiporia weirii]|nr:hypothetical protein M0805_007936 [Coniferiporia weirii]